MSQTTPVAEKSTARSAKQPLVPPDERFWKRYSPHGELPLSGASSLALHLLIFGLMALSAWLAYAVFSHTSRSLPVEAVRLVGGGGNPHGTGEGPNQGRLQEAGGDKVEDGAVKPDPDALERPDLKVKPTVSQPIKFDESAIRQIQQSDTTSSTAMQRLAALKNRIQLPDPKPSGRGQGGPGEGGGSGGGQGTGIGDGRGEGRGTLTQREKRMLRWSMLFDTRSGRDYLAQLEGLGAILAIPTEAGGRNYKIVRDLSARPAKLLDEDISQIQRIYWIDNKLESVRDVMAILGVQIPPSLKPEDVHFVAFMPEKLEQKLFELEKAYMHRRYPRWTEDDIEVTKFKINRTGKSYEPEVRDMEVKKGK